MQAKFHRMLKISKNDQEIALYRLKKDTIIIGKEKQTRKKEAKFDQLYFF